MTFNLAVGVLTLAIMAAYVQCRPSDDVVDIPLKPTDNTCVLKEPKVPGPEDTEESGVPETRREIQGHSKCNAADEKDDDACDCPSGWVCDIENAGSGDGSTPLATCKYTDPSISENNKVKAVVSDSEN